MATQIKYVIRDNDNRYTIYEDAKGDLYLQFDRTGEYFKANHITGKLTHVDSKALVRI